MLSIPKLAVYIVPALLVGTSFILEPVHAEYYLCNVCQNSDDGDRYLANPDQSFVNPASGDTWTCGFLQEAVQDVDPTASGAAGEAYLCSVYQIYAEQYCTCSGPDVPSLLNGRYKDLNPSCNLCDGHTLNYVPYFREEQTVDTGKFGTHNCIGLFEAAMYGNIFDEDSCDEVAQTYGQCCSMPDLVPTDGSSSGSSGNDQISSNVGGSGSNSRRSILPSTNFILFYCLSTIIVLIGTSF
jgi:hypothetical protein